MLALAPSPLPWRRAARGERQPGCGRAGGGGTSRLGRVLTMKRMSCEKKKSDPLLPGVPETPPRRLGPRVVRGRLSRHGPHP